MIVQKEPKGSEREVSVLGEQAERANVSLSRASAGQCKKQRCERLRLSGWETCRSLGLSQHF